MKYKKLMFLIAILIFCRPTIARTRPNIVQAGHVTIIRGANGSIQVDTGNTRMSVPQQPIEREIDDDSFVNDAEFNPSHSRLRIYNHRCGMRSVQSTQQSNFNGSRRTVTQTNISTNICQ